MPPKTPKQRRWARVQCKKGNKGACKVLGKGEKMTTKKGKKK